MLQGKLDCPENSSQYGSQENQRNWLILNKMHVANSIFIRSNYSNNQSSSQIVIVREDRRFNIHPANTNGVIKRHPHLKFRLQANRNFALKPYRLRKQQNRIKCLISIFILKLKRQRFLFLYYWYAPHFKTLIKIHRSEHL